MAWPEQLTPSPPTLTAVEAYVYLYPLVAFGVSIARRKAGVAGERAREERVAARLPSTGRSGDAAGKRDSGTATAQAADLRRCVGATGFEPVTSAV